MGSALNKQPFLSKMPLYKLLSEPGHEVLAIWKTEETVVALLSLLKEKNSLYEIPDGFAHEKRKTEWLCVRLLLHEMFLTHEVIELIYDVKGKPSIKNIEGHISISHTGNYVAVIYHKKNSTGIDIERITPRIEKIAYKFLNEHERQFVQGDNCLEKLYVIWGAKESIFKWYGRGDMDFKTNFNILPFHFNSKGMITAQFILNKDIRELKLQYHMFDDVMLVHLVTY